MALNKQIELSNGITVKYHRIVGINKITNNSTIIEIGSYTSQEKRQEEIEYLNSIKKDKNMNVFINTTYLSKEYLENETIKELYNYLKTTEFLNGAEDI